MKNNFFVFSAVLLVLLFSAFRILPDRRIEYIFQYDGTGGWLLESAVENEANWDFVSTNPDDMDCDEVDEMACKIKVPAVYVNYATTPLTLLTTANVQAVMYDGPIFDTYYVILTESSKVTGKTNHAQN